MFNGHGCDCCHVCSDMNTKIDLGTEEMALSNLLACSYNAVVNHGTERGQRKMHDLCVAHNRYERVHGHNKLQKLVDMGMISGFKSCPDDDGHRCEVRPGGLFHVEGCENDMNHPVYKSRVDLCENELPKKDGAGYAASVNLVG